MASGRPVVYLNVRGKLLPIYACAFDLNGNLVNDTWHCWQGARAVCQRNGVPRDRLPTLEEYRCEDGVHKDPGDFYRMRGVFLSHVAMQVFFRERLQELKPPKLSPGARSVLDRLRKAGVPCSLITLLDADLAGTELDRLGLRKYFVHPEYGDLVFAGLRQKTTPIHEFRLRVGCARRELVFTTDTYRDILQVRSHAIIAANGSGHGHPDVLATAKPDILFSSWSEFGSLLQFEE